MTDPDLANLLPAGMPPGAALELPGAELVLAGLLDLAHGRRTLNAYLASLAVENLRALGYRTPTALTDPEDAVYRILHAEDEDSAHGRYNALVRRVVSFEHAAAHRRRWTDATAG